MSYKYSIDVSLNTRIFFEQIRINGEKVKELVCVAAAKLKHTYY